MIPHTHSSTLSKKFNTSIKASVAILTALILASCSSSNTKSSYAFEDVFGDTPIPVKPTPDVTPAAVEASYTDTAIIGKVTNAANTPLPNTEVMVKLPNDKSFTTTTL